MEGGLGPGCVLGGRYEIQELLGQGGHGAVYRARQRPLGREVAVKVILPEAMAGPGIAERFAREVSLVQRLEHPNTVRLFDFGVADDGTAFMVLELLRGRSLETEMGRGPMAAARVAKIGIQILKSLMEAHALGIIHRDIKPANVLLVDYAGEPDFVKVLDFGVARSVQEDTVRLRPITADGQVVGTPAYMAPEQLRAEPLTPRTDLYAAGLVLAEMLSGSPIFLAPSAAEIWMQQLSSAPVPLPAVARASVLGPVIERATQKSAAARFASAEAMIAAIEHSLRQGALAPTDPLVLPLTSASPRIPPPTTPFAGGAPTAVETAVMPARTPLAMTRPMPATSGTSKLLLVGVPVVFVLVLIGAGVFRFEYEKAIAESRRLPGGPLGPPAVPFEKPEMNTRFLLRKKCQAHGWVLHRAAEGQGKTPRSGTYTYEGYGVASTKTGDMAMIVVVRLQDEVAAELYAADMSADPLRVRDDKYVLYVPKDDPSAFEREVFEVLRRPL